MNVAEFDDGCALDDILVLALVHLIISQAPSPVSDSRCCILGFPEKPTTCAWILHDSEHALYDTFFYNTFATGYARPHITGKSPECKSELFANIPLS